MFVSPMLLQKSKQPFNDSSFITELKLDGIRLIWTKFQDKVRLYTRHNNEVTAKFPELCDLNLPNGTVLDGELIVPDHTGISCSLQCLAIKTLHFRMVLRNYIRDNQFKPY